MIMATFGLVKPLWDLGCRGLGGKSLEFMLGLGLLLGVGVQNSKGVSVNPKSWGVNSKSWGVNSRVGV